MVPLTLAGAARLPPASCAVPTLPASRPAPFRPDSPLPLPLNTPLMITPVALFVTTADGSWASESVPVRFVADTLTFRLVNPAPLP